MSVTSIMSAIPATLIRASVQGIVYLIESSSGKVYTYNLKNPTFIGTLEKIPESDKHMISKTNGCLATARVNYCANVRDIMKGLRATSISNSRAAEAAIPITV